MPLQAVLGPAEPTIVPGRQVMRDGVAPGGVGLTVPNGSARVLGSVHCPLPSHLLRHFARDHRRPGLRKDTQKSSAPVPEESVF